MQKVVSGGIAAFETIAKNQVELENFSKTLGVSRETIAGLNERIGELGGSSDQGLRALQTFGEAIQTSLADPTSNSAKKLEALGVNFDQIKKSATPVEDALQQVGAEAKGLNLSLEQTNAAKDVFGRGFKEVTGALGDLDDAIASIKAKGQFLNDDDAKAARELFSAFDDLSDTLEGIQNQFLADLLPAVKNVTDEINKLKEELGKDEEFKKGFEALKETAGIFVGKTLPLIVDGIGRAVEITAKFGNGIKLLADGFTTLATAGGNVFKAQEEAAEASIRLQLQIQQNHKFLKIFNSTLSESEKLIQSNALVLENEGKALEERRKRLQENTKAQDDLIKKQTEQLGARGELLASIKALKDEQKEGTELAKAEADRRKAAIRQTVKETDEAAAEIGQIDSELAQKQIDNAQKVLDKIQDSLDQQTKDAEELIAKINANETDNQKSYEKTQAVLKASSDFRKLLTPAILDAQKQIGEGENKLAGETENAEKRKQKAKADTQKVIDAQTDLAIAKIDEEIKAKQRIGATDHEIAKLELQRIDIAIDAINKKIGELGKKKERKNTLSDCRTKSRKSSKKSVKSLSRSNPTKSRRRKIRSSRADFGS